MFLRLFCNPKSKINVTPNKIYKIVFLNLSEINSTITEGFQVSGTSNTQTSYLIF